MSCARNCRKTSYIMSATLFFCLIILKFSSAQLNGEFWWLKDQVKQLKGIEPPQPKFEELSEFDTDESSKIIFRDEKFPIRSSPDISHDSNVTEKENPEDDFKEAASIVWPDNVIKHKKPAKKLTTLVNENNLTEAVSSTVSTQQLGSDLFIFRFPDDDSKKKANTPMVTTEAKKKIVQSSDKKDFVGTVTTPKTPLFNKDRMTFKLPVNKHNMRGGIYNEKLIEENSAWSDRNPTKNICTYLKKKKCYEINGEVDMSKTIKSKVSSAYLVCCILPLEAENTHKIVFPDSATWAPKRFRRSNREVTSLNQREFLLRKTFGTQNVKPTPTNTKIVTPEDEYIDPYWNIKNIKFNKKSNAQTITKPDCNYHDYVEDYVSELPKPGLVGIYSDHGPRPPSWTNIDENPNPPYGGTFDYSYEDVETSFGYSTIDPRRGTSSKSPKRKIPIKITTSNPEDGTFDVESQTINFQSNPNFQVLHGFKLLNLARDKNKFYSKNTKRSTTEASIEVGSNESIKTKAQINYDNLSQVYEQCGRSTEYRHDSEISAKAIGEAEIGAHPWLAVVVSTKIPQNILCYATIVHPRVAITAGDCVSDYAKRTSPKEIIAVATGLHDSKDKSQGQNRAASVQLHPRWRLENLAHNLAILHWTLPLRLNSHVQPACLTNSLGSEDCKFYGWGGFDQAMRQRSRWQRASVISPRECRAYISKAVELPHDAFCATVSTRGTVTGLGGSLTCNIGGRAFSAGVAVYRDNALVFIPAHEWIQRAMANLNIE